MLFVELKLGITHMGEAERVRLPRRPTRSLAVRPKADLERAR
jgi:hypothetical protein